MNPGKNDACSCGSGRKYRDCCLGKTPAPAPAELEQLVALFNAGRHAELERRARLLLEKYPDTLFVWNLLGISLRKTASLAASEASYLRALEIEPDYAEAHGNLGNTFREQGRLGEAEASYRRALELNPDCAEVHSNLGNTLSDQGRLVEAEARNRRALECSPDSADIYSNLLLALNYSAGHIPSDCLAEARLYGRIAAKKVTARFAAWQCAQRPGRLRVGLVSGDLYDHPVGYFIESLLAQLDPERVELIAYPTSAKASALTARIKSRFAAWKPLTGLGDEAAARLIHADGVHVLIDLSGHTGHNRLPVFAWKPAPVQVSWLGYFATTGVAEMDYFLADEVGVPTAHRAHFTETVWYLPDTRLCFTPPDTDLPVTPLPAQSRGYITFGCFQRLDKIGDAVLAAWADILAALPGARLRWQCKPLRDPAVAEQLKQRLRRHGIDPARVALHAEVPRNDYLAAHAEVDMVLDTFPYPGGTTTCEALWMGVPTLTLAGDTLLARQGASLLTAAGLEDWIATSVANYIGKAVALAGDLSRLSALRASLREQVKASPLFDAPRFARNFEAALWEMWQQRPDRQQAIMRPQEPTQGEIAQLVALFNAGRHAELESRARSLLDLYPDSGPAWNFLGVALKSQRKDALHAMQKAAELLPDDASAHSNLGVTLKGLERFAEAEASYRRALELNPDFAVAYCNLGNVLREQNRLVEAEVSTRRALEIKPDYAEAHNNLGMILQRLGRLPEAEASSRHALQLKPDFAEAHCSLSVALQEQGRFAAAEDGYRRAIALKPDFFEAYNNLGIVCREQGRLNEAEASYRRALELKPDYAEARDNLLFVLSYSASRTPAECLAEARFYGQLAAKKVTVPFAAWQCADRPERLRVGLVSGDLLDHPVGYFIEGLLTQLDPARIELIAYTTHTRASALTTRIKPRFAAWKPLAGLGDEVAARLIHADGVHVLIDLSGHTGHNRLPVFAWKPAPVQVSWLGYFATTGLAEMDYFLADEVGVPAAHWAHFTETVRYLPDTRLCFTPPDTGLPVASLPASSNGYITFGCFQRSDKIGDDVLAAWAAILDAVPDARLRLASKQLEDATILRQMEQRLQRHGIALSRVVLHGPVSREEYLAAHAEVDMLLDTFPFPGGTTTCEALWMGVPTLTLAGGTLLARQGASLLTAAGLEDWIATSVADYVGKAVVRAGDLAKLSALRVSLREQVKASPLFDAPRFARNVEAALWGMWQEKALATKILNQRGDVMNTVKTFLHVGCGPKRKNQTTRGFNSGAWNELRLDIDQNANPDIVGSMTDMPGVADASVDAIFSSHNIEHLYPHEVLIALKEFLRVLKPDGFLVVTCPDLQSVCALVAEDKLTEPAYTSPAGPIAPLDMLYGHRPALAQGNLYMAHRCGFTQKVLTATLQSNGFAMVAAARRAAPCFDLWAVASKSQMEPEALRQLALQHFPS